MKDRTENERTTRTSNFVIYSPRKLIRAKALDGVQDGSCCDDELPKGKVSWPRG
jgi:hypothetical protein